MADDCVYVVWGWMLNMGIYGYEIPAYAIIYAATKEGMIEYTISQKRLAELMGCTTMTVYTVIKSLCEKGLLKKRYGTRPGKVCTYQVIVPPRKD